MGAKRLSQEKIDRILELAAQGLNRDEIAKQAGVSTGSVSYHLSKPSILTRVPADKIREICEQLTRILEGLKMFQNQGENKENNDQKEEEMSDGDVEARIQARLDREKILEELKEVPQLREELKTVKEQVGQIPDKLTEQLSKFEAKIKAEIENGAKPTAEFCKLYPELCKKTEDTVAKKVEELKPKGILGTDLTIQEFLEDKESQKVLAEKYLSDYGLQKALERCTGPSCDALRQEMQRRGIKIQKKREGGGMLGSDWEDID